MKKRYLAAALVVLPVLFSACGGKTDNLLSQLPETQSPSPSEEETISLTELKLPYLGKPPGNPYTSASKLNTDLCSLLYDPLVKLTPSYQPEMYLAESVTSVDTTHTVRLKSGIYFSDGSPLTADHVLRSFKLAQAEDSFYSGGLSKVLSCTVSDSRTLVFESAAPDADFPNLLTFPIVKELEDGRMLGTGRYILFPGSKTLRRNTGHFQMKTGLDTIQLVAFDSSQGLLNSLRQGTIDCIFTDAPDWSASYLSSETESVDMNRLVLLGINGQRGPLANSGLRQAVLKAVNQQTLVRDAFKSTAIPTSIPINPAFYRLGNTVTTLTNYSPLEIPPIMEELGYKKNADGLYEELSLRLIVNKESSIKRNAAREIASQLALCGISVEVQEYSFAEYQLHLISQNYDLYIGEVEIPWNMDISAVLSQGGTAGYGAAYSPQLLEEYAGVRAGTLEYSSFIATFNQVVPFVPLGYRNGILAFSNDFSANVTATKQDIFYNIEEW